MPSHGTVHALDSIELDWMLVEHDDEGEATTLATKRAFMYLKGLRSGVPTPGVAEVTAITPAEAAAAEEGFCAGWLHGHAAGRGARA